MMQSGSSNRLRGHAIPHQSQRRTKIEWANMARHFFLFWTTMELPWNNNNAEHAIKGFARVRRFADGRFTEDSIREYLVMLSVAERCGYHNIEVLEFLLAQANNWSACQLSLQ